MASDLSAADGRAEIAASWTFPADHAGKGDAGRSNQDEACAKDAQQEP